jgi:hypothetical protein
MVMQIKEGCRDMREAQEERDDYLAGMDAMNACPFSSAQCGR